MWNLPSDPMLFLQLGAPQVGQGEYDLVSVTVRAGHGTTFYSGGVTRKQSGPLTDTELAQLAAERRGPAVRPDPTGNTRSR